MTDNNNILRLSNGDVRSHCSVGGYPLFYVTQYSEVLCPSCVQDDLERCTDLYDGHYIVTHGANFEDKHLYCDHCSERIEAAYED